MKKLIKKLLRENLDEEIKFFDTIDDEVGWDKTNIVITNEEGKYVGYALVDFKMDSDEYVTSSYEDPDAEYVDPDMGRHFPHGNAAKLNNIEISQDFRGDRVNRYGSQLMNAILKRCKEKGVKTIFLNATPVGPEPRISIEDLLKFYRKFGFEVIKIAGAHDMVSQIKEKEV
jgi:ribosomal protein S18 acetylase RimI-like enzyme